MAEIIAIRVPHETVNDESAKLIEWLVADGSVVGAGQAVATLESSKANFQVTAPAAGTIRYSRRVGDEVPIGAVLCHIGPAGFTPPQEMPAHAPVTTASVATIERNVAPASNAIEPNAAFASPRFSAAALAALEERKLDPALFAGRGLVTAHAVREFNGDQSQRAAAAIAPMPGVPFQVHALSRAKRNEIRSLARGQDGMLASAVSIAIPTRGLRQAAAEHAESPADLTALIAFETGRLLRKYPLFNACYRDGEAIVYDEVNIGIAVDAERGLKVPVLRHADRRSAPELHAALQDMLAAYADDTLTPEMLFGGTFTITDLAVEDVFGFAPLINQNQSAILGIGGETAMPGGRLFQLILAFDHRLAEGRMAGRFLRDLRDRLMSYESALTMPATPGCGRCGRAFEELRRQDAMLLNAVNEDGSPTHVCSICLAGW